MKKRPLWPLLPPLVLLAAGYLALFLISQIGSSGTKCGLRQSTGLYCPGCGGTRCAHEILTGDLLSALSHNAMLFSGFILLMLGLMYLIIRMTIMGKPAPRIPDVRPAWLWAIVGGIILFTILRNIPTYPFTLLAP